MATGACGIDCSTCRRHLKGQMQQLRSGHRAVGQTEAGNAGKVIGQPLSAPGLCPDESRRPFPGGLRQVPLRKLLPWPLPFQRASERARHRRLVKAGERLVSRQASDVASCSESPLRFAYLPFWLPDFVASSVT